MMGRRLDAPMNIGEILIWKSSNLTPADPRRDRVGDAGAVVSGKGVVHGAGLAVYDGIKIP